MSSLAASEGWRVVATVNCELNELKYRSRNLRVKTSNRCPLLEMDAPISYGGPSGIVLVGSHNRFLIVSNFRISLSQFF